MEIFLIFLVITILLFSTVAHEVAHGAVANLMGDPTAKNLGRLTLNPMKHLDPVGSILVPLVLLILPGSLLFGWAKPVPYNPFNLRDSRIGGAIIAFAGPATNIIIAILSGTAARVLYETTSLEQTKGAIVALALMAYINIILAIFNLFPIPPLDGSKILYAFVRVSEPTRRSLEQYGFFILLAFILFGGGLLLGSIIGNIFPFITGSPVADLFYREVF